MRWSSFSPLFLLFFQLFTPLKPFLAKTKASSTPPLTLATSTIINPNTTAPNLTLTTSMLVPPPKAEAAASASARNNPVRYLGLFAQLLLLLLKPQMPYTVSSPTLSRLTPFSSPAIHQFISSGNICAVSLILSSLLSYSSYYTHNSLASVLIIMASNVSSRASLSPSSSLTSVI